jgi:3-methyladenine DNA glycosylase AlkD
MPDEVREVRRRIAERLAEEADPERAPRMQAYMKSAMPFRGVPSPVLHRLCKQVLDEVVLPDRASWEAAVREVWDRADYREERYAALALAGHRRYRDYRDPAALPLYRHLVVTGAWWDLVDTIASHHVGEILRTHHDETVPVLRAWAVDDDLWLRRTAILAQLGRKADTDVDLLAFALTSNLEDSLHGKEFFVRKALGWALREHARTDPDWVRRFVASYDGRLSGLTRREALKHVTTPTRGAATRQ